MSTTEQVDRVSAKTVRLRPAAERGHADHGWLKSAHSFSFAGYHDPEHVHFEALRVINDDFVAAGQGFPPHPHQDFEIFSYVLEGEIQHKDSLGNGSIVSAGGIQYMTAGSGVRHSEYNPSPDNDLRFLQIWLMPKVRGANPRYQVKELSPEDKSGRLALFIAEDGRGDAIKTLAPADVYAGTFDGDQTAKFELREGRSAWIQVARGSLSVKGVALKRGDGLAITETGTIAIENGEDAEILLFDLQKLS